MKQQNVDSLAKAGKELMLKEPFYGLFLMSLNKIWTNLIPTMGVSLKNINYNLLINEEFWESLNGFQKIGLVKHEVLHIGFFHLTDYDDYQNKEILNIAMDCEINQYIDRNWLPEEGVFLDKLQAAYPQLQLEAKKGTRYYYDKLMSLAQSGDSAMQIVIVGMPKNGDGKMEVELPNGQSITITDHDWEKATEGLSDATKKLIENQTKHVLNQIAEQVTKSRGTIPGEFTDILERINKIEPPKFDWKGYIRRFAGKSTKTYTKLCRRKLNKRFEELPGLKVKKQKHILAAIDTSGSVSNDELREFLGELYHLTKTGAEVTIVQCDTAISFIGKFDPKKDFVVHGRGGTDFNPPVDHYLQNQGKYSCLIYFTDGEAPAPDNAGGSILWVLSERSAMNNNLPGHVIKLEL